MAPRSRDVPEGSSAFARWLYRQPQLDVPPSWRVKPVTLVECVDYQSNASRQANGAYAEMIRGLEEERGDRFAFVRIDFPLDSECNPAGPLGRAPHPAACEAAAAVRAAKSIGVEEANQFQRWLWANQDLLTPDFVIQGLQEQVGLVLAPVYSELLSLVSRDAADAARLGVSTAPAFFLNGRRLPNLAPAALRAAITLELGDHVRASGGAGR